MNPLPSAVFTPLPTTRPHDGRALVINIFGGPGTGKSTLAAEVFCRMKQSHIETACPEEHAKLAIWSGQPWLLDQQVILLGQSWQTIHARLRKVDVIVVDSPVLLCSVYAQGGEPDCFHDLVTDIHRRTDRINILLQRNTERDYSPDGRRENALEALEMDARIEETLRKCDEEVIVSGDYPDLVERLIATALAHRDISQ